MSHPINIKPSIKPSIARVRRTEKHLLDLHAEVEHLIRRQEDVMMCDFDPKPPHELKLIEPIWALPPEIIGILIGEVCYNLRSAMDYLVYNLAWLDSGTVQDMTQFPIEDSKKGYAGRHSTWLKGISAAHIAELEILQPYNGCEWTKILRDLSNRDKHRELAHIFSSIQATGYLQTHRRYPELASTPRCAMHPDFGPMSVKIDFTGRMEFEDGMPIVEALETVKLGVSDALDAFESDFP